jgi:hypothetical protein
MLPCFEWAMCKTCWILRMASWNRYSARHHNDCSRRSRRRQPNNQKRLRRRAVPVNEKRRSMHEHRRNELLMLQIRSVVVPTKRRRNAKKHHFGKDSPSATRGGGRGKDKVIRSERRCSDCLLQNNRAATAENCRGQFGSKKQNQIQNVSMNKILRFLHSNRRRILLGARRASRWLLRRRT